MKLGIALLATGLVLYVAGMVLDGLMVWAKWHNSRRAAKESEAGG